MGSEMCIRDSGISDTAASITLNFSNGSRVDHIHDLMDPIDDAHLTQRLREKAQAVAGDKSEALWSRIFDAGSDSSRTLHNCL